eukprot:UN24124
MKRQKRRSLTQVKKKNQTQNIEKPTDIGKNVSKPSKMTETKTRKVNHIFTTNKDNKAPIPYQSVFNRMKLQPKISKIKVSEISKKKSTNSQNNTEISKKKEGIGKRNRK